MNNKKIYLFSVLTFVWSWTFWLIGLDHLTKGITQEAIGMFIKYFFTGIYGPTVSAILTTVIFNGLKGTLTLLKKLLIWKVPVKNYFLIILLPLIFVIIGIGFYGLFFGDIGSFNKMGFLSIPTVLWAGFYAGPLGEELGWRGFYFTNFKKDFPV